ncbi:MAG: MFS transporter [Burkholderiales bacterium]|nr:MFS transporter [Burkholderiales bacterium]MCZ8108955.1 MFS transporter [Burkholderiales bacterium]
MKIESLRFQVGLIALMQALLLTNNVTLIAINGLAGAMLASDPTFATLPVTGYVLGAALSSMAASRLMRLRGRRAGYTVGSLFAIAGTLLAGYAVSERNLPLLVAATFVVGVYNAFGASLRFAAADAADAWRPNFRARAISLVLAAGIVGGVVGPEVSKLTREALPTMFAGSYLALSLFGVVSLALAQLLRLPESKAGTASGPARRLREILAQPVAWVAVLVAALSYGVMNLVMVATPLAMQVCSHPYAAAAFVLEWHVIGMFAPGLFTGSLIGRVGIVPVIVTGCLLMLVSAVIALSGIGLWEFTVALAALGVGWNFMYTGATTLLTTCYRPSEKNRVQGFNDACVFATMVSSSFSSGALLHVQGWYTINALSVPFVLVALGATLWAARSAGWRVGRVAA